MTRLPGIGAALVVSLSCLAVPAGAMAQALRVVPDVDLTRYVGRWFEVARLPNKAQSSCTSDVVFHYTLRADGRIDVVNQCRKADGKLEEARGIGRKAGDRMTSARLEMRFAPAIFSFAPAAWRDYWIIGVGPEYTWAVAGAPNREQLWILSRSPEMSETSFRQAIEIGKGNGFDVTKLVRTKQSSRR